MNTVFSGKTYVTGDNTTAYKISYNTRWKECGTNAEALGQWLFEPIISTVEGVPNGFKSMGYEVVVSGVDFGGGFKSNDHPVLTLKGAGIKLLIAEKFNRIFFRNAINLGMPLSPVPVFWKWPTRVTFWRGTSPQVWSQTRPPEPFCRGSPLVSWP